MYGENIREAAYRFYIADSLYAYGHNGVLNLKYSELVDKITNPAQEEQAEGADIVNDLMARHGLRFDL